jgi:hypothetical protein
VGISRIRSLVLILGAISGSLAHAAGKPELIYPDAPGSSQSCVVPVNPATKRISLAAGAELMLMNCKASQGWVFHVSKDRIAIAGKPGLCLNLGAGARRGIVYLEQCKDTTVKSWDAVGSAVEARRIRAVGGTWNNQCWSIPQLANEKAKFPIPVELDDCKAGRDLTFFIEPKE